ncbi:hypothetical protein C943_03270 [Mariniradius saccharolyticus AK6]|uniref:Uncharacterized protein n=1 Tax=Mariniradius saccharolyticus AK6 TaxID=1239962 RepID=M7XJ47_9BACT|nr:hypothetical protein [Mariniradius saccharolyticus]EMS34583.1 hypothetical protein C943_03270 [Mariniradius saccharolyticus AK6]
MILILSNSRAHEYLATIQFIQDEMMASRKELAEEKGKDPELQDAKKIQTLEHEIELLEIGVDRYQSKVNLLK